jgi:hypothetical protein
MELSNKNKRIQIGLLYAILGMLFSIIAGALMTMNSPSIFYLAAAFLGVLLAIYGVFILLKAMSNKN